MESSPLRAIPLLSISSPCRGILFYRYRGRTRGRLVLGIEDLKKAELWLWLMIYIHVLKCLILIYVLYKSENIVTLVTIWYIVGFIVSMYYEYRLWAQVAVLLMSLDIFDILHCLGQVYVGFVFG